jgi:insulysin
MVNRLALCMIFVFSLPFFLLAEEQAPYTIIQDKAKVHVLSPAFSARKTLKIKLKNGLEAYLISDPNTDLSGAALSVSVGSWEDPKENPGLAHFTEHMLFLGTKKFPNESEYDRYITEHGGIGNAFTSNDSTSYLFTINNDAFDEALERFSSFFKEPLFNPSGVGRELQAIDQEYAKNLENDTIREYFVYKGLSNPDHPNYYFTMGNLNSLSKVSQDTLKEWYRSHYSANLMRLIVVSSLPLDKLTELVVRDFQDVPSFEKKPLSLDIQAISEAAKGHMIYIEPVKNIRDLTLLWELPPKFADLHDTKPEAITCYVLGHEGTESLLAYLKREKLAESLRCGGSKVGPGSMQFFLTIELTDEGVNQVDKVIANVFQAIHNFQKKGVPAYLYEEIHQIQLLQYQFQSREDLFTLLMKHAQWITDENLETYPEQSTVIQKFSPEDVLELLANLTPQNALFTLSAPSALTGIVPDHTEKWMNVHYAIRPIPSAKLTGWATIPPNPQIDIPAPNPFIPKNLQLKNGSKEAPKQKEFILPVPDVLINSDSALVYFAEDEFYLTPQISWNFQIRTPEISSADPLKVVMADLYIKYVKEALNAFSYNAQMAGLDFDLDRKENGIALSISGYSEKADLLLAEILSQLINLKPSEQKFKIYKDSLSRQYQNDQREMPLRQAGDLLKDILYKNYTTERQKAFAIRKVSYEKFLDYAKTLFSKNFLEGMLYGNMSRAAAEQLIEKMLKTIGGEPYPISEQIKVEVVNLPADKGPFYIEHKSKSQGNAVILAIEGKDFSPKARAAQQILMQAIGEPFFAELRTRQQTGYIVSSSAEELEKKLFSLFAVQSNTHDVRDLLARFELFIEAYLQNLSLKEMSPERFVVVNAALLDIIKQPPKNTVEMSKLLNTLAFKYDGDFKWMEKRKQGFRELTYKEFIEMSTALLGKANKKRAAVLLKGEIPEINDFRYTRLLNAQQLKKMSEYTPR